MHKAEYYAALRRLPLPKPATWLEEGIRGKTTVLIDTIQRFKGLESPVIILWGLDTIDFLQRKELLYVGMSCAKSLLIIAGRTATCATFRDTTDWLLDAGSIPKSEIEPAFAATLPEIRFPDRIFAG